MKPQDEAYRALSDRVDTFPIRVGAMYPDALTCHAGCSSCCHQHLSVVPIEWRRLREAIASLASPEREALAARVQAGRADPRCPLLDDTGRCRTYEARPMICRSHGLPIQIGEEGQRDVCPLNFTGGPSLDALDPDLVLDVDRLDQMVGLMCTLEGDDPLDRVDLFEGIGGLLGVELPAEEDADRL